MSAEMGDINLREALGLLNLKNEVKLKLTETLDSIIAETRIAGCSLTPDQARWYARKLYWLARRIDARAKAAHPDTAEAAE